MSSNNNMSLNQTLFNDTLRRSFSSIVCSLFCLMTFPVAVMSSKSSDTVLCPISEYIDDSDKTVTEYFECPGADDPPENTFCCIDKCCTNYSIDSVLQVDLEIAMIISLTVIVICVISSIVIIICCFASCCPMYDTCTSSGGWHSKSDENATLPFTWATEYNESELVQPTVNGRVTTSGDKKHELEESGNKKIVKVEHV